MRAGGRGLEAFSLYTPFLTGNFFSSAEIMAAKLYQLHSPYYLESDKKRV